MNILEQAKIMFHPCTVADFTLPGVDRPTELLYIVSENTNVKSGFYGKTEITRLWEKYQYNKQFNEKLIKCLD